MVSELTQMLRRWKGADAGVEALLVERLYPEIHAVAERQLRRFPGVQTLQATEVVHEAFERLREQDFADVNDRVHFFAIAATVIRRFLVDHLRRKGSQKRGEDVVHVALDDLLPGEAAAAAATSDWLEIDRALSELGRLDAGCARVVEMRVFGGLTVEEVAQVLETSESTVNRQWRFARSWLGSRLGP